MISLSQVGKDSNDTAGKQTYKKVFVVTTGLQPKTFRVLRITPNQDQRTAELDVELPGGKRETQKNVPMNNKNFRIDDPKSVAVDLKSAYEEMYGKRDLGLGESTEPKTRYMLRRKSDNKFLTNDRRYTDELEAAGVFNVGDVDMSRAAEAFPQFDIIPVNEGHGDVHYWGAQPKSKEYSVSSKPDKATMALKEVIQGLLFEVMSEDDEQKLGYSENQEIQLIKSIASIARTAKSRKIPTMSDIEEIDRIAETLLKMHNELEETMNPKCKSCGKPVNANVSPADKCNCVS